MGRKKDILKDVREIDLWRFDDSRQVYVSRQTGRLQDNPDLLRPHRLGYFAVRWLVKGEISAYVDHIPYHLKPDTLMVANPKQISWFALEDASQELDVRLIIFSPSYFQDLPLEPAIGQKLQGTLRHFFCHLTSEHLAVIKQYFELIEGEHGSLPEQTRDQFIAPLIAALLGRIALITEDLLAGDRDGGYQVLYREFLELLEENFKNWHDVDTYVRSLNVSDRKLNRACHALASTSAGKIIQNRIDFEAKRLLRFSTYSAKEIGYHLGFKDPAHFSKFFTKRNGMPPGKLRKQ